MTPAEVRAIIEAELKRDDSALINHGVDLRRCLVEPKVVACRNAHSPSVDMEALWIVLEESPGTRDGYLVLFDEELGLFGLGVWDGEVPASIGFHGTFLDALRGM